MTACQVFRARNKCQAIGKRNLIVFRLAVQQVIVPLSKKVILVFLS